jgi:hypothetical protein
MMMSKNEPDKSPPPAMIRIIGWVFFVLAFLGAYFLVRWLMSR